jgi:transportin-1
LFKEYLCETLRRFLDNEIIVQDAAQSAFTGMINTDKEKVEPYLLDIIKIITNAFDNSTGTNLLTLYEMVSLLADTYEDHFKNKSLVNNLIKCVVKKWYSIMNSKDNIHLCPVFEMICSVLKASHSIMNEYIDDFINGSTSLLEKDSLGEMDKEVVIKCIDLISVICHTSPNIIKNHSQKNKIFEISLKLIDNENLYVRHYVIALIGDFCKVDPDLLKPNADLLIKNLIKNLELFNKYETVEIEKLSVCNNTCWSLGLISIYLKDDIVMYVNLIIKHLLKIISLPKVLILLNQLNKSLAQNVSICIGRLGLVYPDELKEFLDKFIKQFCLSLRNIKDSNEKQDAFR